MFSLYMLKYFIVDIVNTYNNVVLQLTIEVRSLNALIKKGINTSRYVVLMHPGLIVLIYTKSY